jgi:hypothetical protein
MEVKEVKEAIEELRGLSDQAVRGLCSEYYRQTMDYSYGFG